MLDDEYDDEGVDLVEALGDEDGKGKTVVGIA